MAHTYITELASNGHASARGSKYTYTYESHIDGGEPLPLESPPGATQFPASSSSTSFSPNGTDFEDHAQRMVTTLDNGLERHSTSTQKVL